MNKYKIVVYAISKNEEKFVDRWVDSMQEADEIYNGRIARWNDGAVVLVECIN